MIFTMKSWIIGIIVLSMLTNSLAVTIKVGVINMEWSREPFDIRRLGPAIDIAVEDIIVDYNITFDTIKRTYKGLCPYEPPVGILSEMYYKHNIQALIGPACSQGVQSAGRLSAYLGLPIVTGLGDLVIRKQGFDEYATLTRLSFNIQKLECMRF